MKKFLTALICVLLSLTTVFAFTACRDTGGNISQTDQSGGQLTPETPDGTEPVAPGGYGSVLVVYFSATGNTEAVANYIAESTNGTLFEIVPVNKYTDADLNYSNHNSRVYQEYENEELRDVELVSTAIENWDEYDTVFIGYPIWWGIAAWPVNDFIEDNDFTGKTVIPICTSSSSGLGQSGTLLEELAGTGNWLQGHRFRSSVSESDVSSWLEELGVI